MNYYYGIDIGGTFVKLGIVDENYKLVCNGSVPFESDVTSLCRNIRKEYERLISASDVDFGEKRSQKVEDDEDYGCLPSSIIMAGIGCAGMIDSKRGVVHFAGNLKWFEIPIAEEISKVLGVPACVTNDANCAALGEYTCGYGKDYTDLLLVTLGTGVGGGIIADGKLFEGGRSAGAELGHMTLMSGGRICSCGRRGCFETYASARALKKIAGLPPEELTNKVMSGDEDAKRIWDKYTDYVADGIVGLANVMRPQIVLLGGGVSNAGELLASPVRKKVRDGLFAADYATIDVQTASLGNMAGMLGAVAYVRSRLEK